MKKDGFIYPIYNGKVRYDWQQTPLLIEMRNELDLKIKALRKLRALMFLTGIFAGAVADRFVPELTQSPTRHGHAG
jgi:hypothetical protein